MTTALKFGRNYELSVETGIDSATGSRRTVTITLPFTVEIDITRNTLAGANVCHLRIYNLARQAREDIVFNAFNTSDYRQVRLLAGYGANLSTAFVGNVTQCWSVREGTNFITELESYDGGFAIVNGENTWAGASFNAGTPQNIVIATLMKALPNVTPGAIGAFNEAIPKDVTYSGNPAQILTDITGGAFFIDSGKAYVLKPNEYIQANNVALVVNDATGLLNTPVREQSMLRFEMLFEPSMSIGTLIQLASGTFPDVNGYYKVTSVKHRGIISPVVGGKMTTIVEMNSSKENIPVTSSDDSSFANLISSIA